MPSISWGSDGTRRSGGKGGGGGSRQWKIKTNRNSQQLLKTLPTFVLDLEGGVGILPKVCGEGTKSVKEKPGFSWFAPSVQKKGDSDRHGGERLTVEHRAELKWRHAGIREGH